MKISKRWLDCLLELVALDTTNPPGKNYQAAIDFLQPLFKKTGFSLELVKIPAKICQNRVNLLVHCRQPGKPRLLVYSHIDVVPAEADWQPFAPKIKGNKIYGRGVADMKGAIVAFLMAAEAINDKNWPWDVTVMVTTDEETNQKEQVEYLLTKKIDKAKGATFLDLDSCFGYASIGGLGDINFKVTVLGKSVHSGIAHTGINAVEKSILVLEALSKLKKKVESRFSKIPVNPDLGIKTMQAKLNIDVIKGGLKSNIVPDKCEIEVDRRLIPEEKIEVAKKEIEEALSLLKGKVNFKLEFVHSMSGYGKVSPAAEKMAKLIKKVTGKTGIYGVMGSGDLLGMAADYDWQMVGVGVIRDKESNIHGREENVVIKDIENLAEILRQFLLNLDNFKRE